jgi:hypothetical protein
MNGQPLPGVFTHRERARGTRWLGGCVVGGGEQKNSQPMPGLEPLPQRYTNELSRLLIE